MCQCLPMYVLFVNFSLFFSFFFSFCLFVLLYSDLFVGFYLTVFEREKEKAWSLTGCEVGEN